MKFARDRLAMALFFLSALALVAPTFAATVGELEPATGTWRVYRGSGFTTFVCSAASEQGAKDCAAADAEARRTTTRYQIRYPNRYVTATYAPSAPVDCVVSAWSEWTGGTWSACTNGTQTRQETRTRTVVTQPVNGGAACPVLTEARTATQACESPPTGDWVHCARQEETLCTGAGTIGAYTGTRTIRYGIDTRWIEREMTSGIRCNSTIFGGNPASGVTKTCQVRGTSEPPPPPPPPPPPATGTATLNWTPNTTMSDGTPATLAGFRIRYGRSADTLTLQREIAGPATTAVVGELASGTWYFGVTAYDTLGRESLPSNTASKVVQ